MPLRQMFLTGSSMPHPNRKWIADFTYVWTKEGWLYVAPSLICSHAVLSVGQ